MKFYTKLHNFYCGIDLHARILYVCVLNNKGEKVLHQKVGADKQTLSALAHKLGRAVYFMLKNKTVFDNERFLKA